MTMGQWWIDRAIPKYLQIGLSKFYIVYHKFHTDQPSNCINIPPFPFPVNSVTLCEQRLSERPPGGSILDESIPSQHIQNKIHTYKNVSTVLKSITSMSIHTHSTNSKFGVRQSH